MEPYDHLTRALAHLAADVMTPAESPRTILARALDDGPDGAIVQALGFRTPSELMQWAEHPDRTHADLVSRLETGRDAILNQVATQAAGVAGTPARSKIEGEIGRLVSAFLIGDHEAIVGRILSKHKPVMAGFLVHQVVTRLLLRAADDEVERLGCWLALQAHLEHALPAPGRAAAARLPTMPRFGGLRPTTVSAPHREGGVHLPFQRSPVTDSSLLDALQKAQPRTIAVWIEIITHRRIVERYLDGLASGAPGLKADRRLLIATFLATVNYTTTAHICGIKSERVRQLLMLALRHLRSLRLKRKRLWTVAPTPLGHAK